MPQFYLALGKCLLSTVQLFSCQQIQYLLIEGGMKKDTKYPINWNKSWHYHFNSLTNRTRTRSKVIYKDHTCHILIILSSLHQANLIKYEEKIRGFSFIS